MLQSKMFEGRYDPFVAGIGTRSKACAVSADNDLKQGKDGNDAGFLSLTKFHWSLKKL